jgi:hypothetical protein
MVEGIQMLKVKRWSRPASVAFSLLFIAIMCFTLLPSPVQIGPLSFGGAGVAHASTVETFTTAGTFYWICPAGVTSVQVEVWGAGAGGSGEWLFSGDYFSGPAGGGGAYARLNAQAVTPGGNYTIVVGVAGAAGPHSDSAFLGGAGGDSYFINAATLNAKGGEGGGITGGAVGATGDVKYSGGNGYSWTLNGAGGGGGSSGGPGSAGNNGALPTGATAVTGGGPGGNGGADNVSGSAPASGPGGGGGGGGHYHTSVHTSGGAGRAGQVKLTYTVTPLAIATLAATSITTTSATLNGNVTSLSSYGNVTSCGFVLSTTTVANSPGNVSPSAQTTYTAGNWTWTGVQYAAGQTFDSNGNVTGLTSGTYYYFRAAGYSTYGWVYGDEAILTTLPGANFLTGYRNRIKVETTSSSAITGDAEMFDAYYGSAPMELSSSTQFLYAPAARYAGTHDRTYIAGISIVTSIISIRQWDEDDLVLSSPVTLWTIGSYDGDDHAGCSVIVLQHQTGNNTVANGSILVATSYGFAGNYLGSRRSINTESIGTSSSNWGTTCAFPNTHSGVYPGLTETSDGVIRCFTQERDDANAGLQIYMRTLTIDPANPTNDSWSARTLVSDTYNGGGAYKWTYHKEWVDGADIHMALMSCYEDIWYIKLQGNDTTWRTAGGTQKYLPLNNSVGNNTLDAVFTTGVGNYTALWDIKTDTSHNPYILFYDGLPGQVDDTTCDLYRANYTGGAWVNTDTTIDGVFFGLDSGLLSGANLDQYDVDIIYAAVPDGSDNSQIQKWELSGSTWSKTEDITQASPGDNYRPIYVINGAGHFKILWFYTERYQFDVYSWDSMRCAYPGFSNQSFLCLNKISRTDFGDLRLTMGDGSTLQPSASSGVPWIQEKTDSWRAILWWKIGNVPVSPLVLTNYVYYGNSTNTNANTQAIMDAQFLACDHFDAFGGNSTALDTNKWTLTNTVGVASSNLELTSVAASQGLIDQNITNYPLFTYGEVRFKAKGSDTAVGDYSDIGLRATGSYNEAVIFLWMNSANVLNIQTRKGGLDSGTALSNMDTANWHTMRATWTTGSTSFYHDGGWNTARNLAGYSWRATYTTNVSSSAQGLTAIEGYIASGVVYVDWIFARPYPSATVSALTQEVFDISNTPSSHDFGIVQTSHVYSTGFDWGNLTNNSAFAVDVSISGTDMTGGGYTWALSETATPGNMTYGMKATLPPNNYVGTVATTTNVYGIRLPGQQKTFFANGRAWVFYFDGSNFSFKTSTDYENWSTATTIAGGVAGAYFSLYFDGTYVHYIRRVSGDTDNGQYRRGIPNAGGNITWSEPESQAITETFTDAYICVDSNGYPWIGYAGYGTTTSLATVTKSSINNGNWTTEDGFPYVLSSVTYSDAIPVPLTEGKVYLVYYPTSKYSGEQRVRGKLWDGYWSDEEVASSSNVDNVFYARIATVAVDNNVHVAFLKKTSLDIIYINRTYGIGWGNESTIQASAATGSSPVISYDISNNDLYIFWSGSPTTNHIYYKKCILGIWDTNPVDWIDESIDTLTRNDDISCSYKSDAGIIGVLYQTKSSSPYNIKYAHIGYDIVVAPSETSFIANLGPSESRQWGLLFLAPTTYINENNQKLGNITLTAEAS